LNQSISGPHQHRKELMIQLSYREDGGEEQQSYSGELLKSIA
jgi:hypothetical protein